VLGKGNFGEVLLGVNKISHEKCAIKIISSRKGTSREKEIALNENAILECLKK